MPTIRTAGLLVALAAMGCAPAEPSGVTEAPTDLPSATVAIGETTRVDGVPVTPLAVLEDSRCARDVACVWAGSVRIRSEARRVGKECVSTVRSRGSPDHE